MANVGDTTPAVPVIRMALSTQAARSGGTNRPPRTPKWIPGVCDCEVEDAHKKQDPLTGESERVLND